MANQTLKDDYIRSKQRGFKEAVGRVNRQLQQYADTQPEHAPMVETLAHLFANAWLRSEVHPDYTQAVTALSRNPEHQFLVNLLLKRLDDRHFVQSHLSAALQSTPEHPRHQRAAWLLAQHGQDLQQTTQAILDQWQQSSLQPTADFQAITRQVGAEEKSRYSERLGEYEQQRLELIDALPEQFGSETPFEKVGIIPRMACPQSCRHCMFVWRPVMRDLPDPSPLYKQINRLTKQVLFTGGDLTPVLEGFHQAIASMPRIRLFAILLNGDFAKDDHATRAVLQGFQHALNQRSKKAAPAEIILQISFDEFHQEILADRHGQLKERIAVANIARIVQATADYPQIKLSLLHKQNSLNFSEALFRDGVFARLTQALNHMGESLELLQVTKTPTKKRHPVDANTQAPVIREALMVLKRTPDQPIHWMSGTTDTYGRAGYLEPSQFVNDRMQLDAYLQGTPMEEEFDTDPMVWLDGHVSLFSATHITMGHLFQESWETILGRWRRDPLLDALKRFDPKLISLYQQLKPDTDLSQLNCTSPHQLFHYMTESAAIRLQLTQKLVDQSMP
ncbi:hypothetical protein [Magnetococcus sp. PR-3]|uniref:hypothetical protein n=1 Tax=Magnetococcus sp. PR-3 TaxID=3120355 RepID=UPI002FCE1146